MIDHSACTKTPKAYRVESKGKFNDKLFGYRVERKGKESLMINYSACTKRTVATNHIVDRIREQGEKHLIKSLWMVFLGCNGNDKCKVMKV